MKDDGKALPASAVIVALHNSITRSIGRQYFLNGRGKLYCLGEVLQRLPVASVFQQLPAALGATALAAWQMWTKDLPGLGPDSDPSC